MSGKFIVEFADNSSIVSYVEMGTEMLGAFWVEKWYYDCTRNTCQVIWGGEQFDDIDDKNDFHLIDREHQRLMIETTFYSYVQQIIKG